MFHNGRRVKVTVNLKGQVAPETVVDIINHCKNGQSFALLSEDGKDACIFSPLHLISTDSQKNSTKYNTLEDLIDTVKLSMIVLPVFISQAKLVKIAGEQKLLT